MPFKWHRGLFLTKRRSLFLLCATERNDERYRSVVNSVCQMPVDAFKQGQACKTYITIHERLRLFAHYRIFAVRKKSVT